MSDIDNIANDTITSTIAPSSSSSSSPIAATTTTTSQRVPDFEVINILSFTNQTYIDIQPPQASVSRVIKQVLDDNLQVTKDARAGTTTTNYYYRYYITNPIN